MDNLTNPEFWDQHWQNREAELTKPLTLPNKVAQWLSEIVTKNQIHTVCELGGFPGQFTVYLSKEHQTQCTLLDYVLHENTVRKLELNSGLKANTIRCIQADVFTDPNPIEHDMVFSLGLIEHFEDTKKIITAHLKYLRKGGILYIMLPNFTGLNGWFQRKLDPANYAIHNIKSMDLSLLREIAIDLQLNDIRISYDGYFGIWLEPSSKANSFGKLFFKLCSIVGRIFFKIVPINSKYFSPYIILQAKK